jgi:Domain of unknown function (DUF4129)
VTRLLTTLHSATPGSLFPDPGSAREWLRDELARPAYQEPLLERFARWFNELVDSARDAAGQSDGLSRLVALVLLALLVVGVAAALSRLRANPAQPRSGTALFSEAPETAEEHRRRADAALRDEQWDAAVIESVRALASGLVERDLMAEQSGVTAHELTGRAAELFPRHRSRLETMSTVFDETRYGDRAADEASAREVVELEAELGSGIPEGAGARGPAIVVPR